jgi:hypothetical protein
MAQKILDEEVVNESGTYPLNFSFAFCPREESRALVRPRRSAAITNLASPFTWSPLLRIMVPQQPLKPATQETSNERAR